MKKKWKIGLSALMLAAAAALGGLAFYMYTLRDSSGFLDGTLINGIDVSGKTPEETAGILTGTALEEEEAVLVENGEEVFRAPLSDLGYSLDQAGLQKELAACLQAETTDYSTILRGILQGNSFELDLPYGLDEKAFAKAVRADALSAPRRENENAKILYYEKDRECRIKPEVQGTELKDQDLQQWLRGEIEAVLQEADGQESAASGSATDWPAGDRENNPAGAAGTASAEGAAGVDHESAAGTAAEGTENNGDIVRTIPASLYIPPEKTADNEKLQEKCRLLNELAGESVTYVFGEQKKTLDFNTIMNWLRIKDGKISVKEDKVQEYVRKLAEKYETRYMDRTFHTTWGGEVTFPAGLNEYGYTILEDQEAAQLTQDILSGKSVEREPVYQTLGAWGDPLFLRRNGTDDMAGTYVEVSIGAQHMWYYVNGELLIESDVVTGDITENQGTATGVFPLAFKESPSILRGGEGKKKYETKVQYWMPFYEGQGLHDAWWKSVFGGSEYIGNGSHGCVNLPPWVAEIVYNNIEPGTAIVIYN